MFLGEVLSACYLLWLPFWLRVLLLIVCLAIGLFGNKFLIIQKKKKKKFSTSICDFYGIVDAVMGIPLSFSKQWLVVITIILKFSKKYGDVFVLRRPFLYCHSLG